jgi:hypothetical protein
VTSKKEEREKKKGNPFRQTKKGSKIFRTPNKSNNRRAQLWEKEK